MVSKLDELCFVPPSLLKVNDGELDVGVQIGVAGCERSLQLGLPVLIREIGPERLGSDWSDFCSILQEHGVAITGGVDVLSELPANAVPLRIARESVGQALNPHEVSTADMVEFSLRRPRNASWELPEEIGELDRMADFLQALRESASGNTPVGIEIPVGLGLDQVQAICEIPVDFISISEDPEVSCPEMLAIWSLRGLRRFAKQTPVIVNRSCAEVTDVLKLLALGADIVAVDALVAPILPEPEEEVGGYAPGRLASLGVAAPPSVSEAMQKFGQWLSEFKRVLERQMQFCGANSLKSFDSECLKSTNEAMASLSGVSSMVEPFSDTLA